MTEPLTTQEILDLIPHKKPFRFIDELSRVSSEYSEGVYTFKKNEFFYDGHFPGKPITPGVILAETMAQIGLIPIGIMSYLDEFPNEMITGILPVFTDAQVKFLKPVYPETKVVVQAEKVYFRMNRLKAKARLLDQKGNICASGILNGTFIKDEEEPH